MEDLFKQKMSGKVLVQNTNISCVVSKWSTSQRGYFPDKFLEYLTEKMQCRSPLINRGYYARAQAIHQLLKSVLLETINKKYQILSLGAGFDTTFFKLKSEGLFKSGCHYFEIDFPEVLSQKLDLIMKHEELKGYTGVNLEHDNKHIVFSSNSFSLVGGDLYQIESLQKSLVQAGLDHSLPSIFLSECVMNYMDPSKSDVILKWACNSFNQAVFIMYEQICPSDGFGHTMKSHFERIGSPLLSIDTYPTITSQKQRLHNLGWPQVEVQDLNSILAGVDSREQVRVEKLEPFDEFEELHLKCSHYILACARKGWHTETEGNENVVNQNGQQNEEVNSSLIASQLWEGTPCLSACRFGHAAVRLSKNEVLLSGGFGKEKHGHTRLKGLKLLDTLSGQGQDIILEDPHNLLGERMFHKMVWLPHQECALVIGGRSSPAKALDRPPVIYLRKVPQKTGLLQNYVNEKASGPTSINTELSHCDFSDSRNFRAEINNASEINIPKDCLQHGRTEVLHKLKNNKKNKQRRSFDVDVEGARCENQTGLPVDSKERQVWKVEDSITTGDVPTPRWRHSAILLPNPEDKGKEQVLVLGGRDHTGRTLSDSFLLQCDKSHWTKIPEGNDDPPARHSHACALWKGKVLVSGGISENREVLNDIFLYHPESRSWSRFPTQQNLIPRYSHSAHVSGDGLFLIGGVTTSSVPNGSPGISKVCLKTGLCQQAELKIPLALQPILLFKHASFLDEDNEELSILILGGGGNCFSFGTAFNTRLLHLRLQIKPF